MNKKIVIIGASSGIGRMVALTMARLGWDVAIAARRDERLKATAALAPDRIVWKTIDVTASDAAERFNGLIRERGGMDVLLYCAGTGYQDASLDPGLVEATLQTNVVGFARILNAAYRYFRDTANVTTGQIAVITSVAGTKGLGISAAYSASKRFEQIYIDALEQLAYTRHVNVAFTDIRPGFITTALLDSSKTYPMAMSLQYAVPRIVKAILRRKRVAVIDSRWRIVTAMWSLIPQAVWRHINIEI